MKLGYCRKSITPEESVPLAGYGNTSFRMSTENLDEIYTTAVAFSDGEHTAIFIENDLTTSVKSITDETRRRISEKTGVPVESIMVAAIHLHSAPDMWNTDEPSIVRYNPQLVDAMVAAAVEAVADMSEATAKAAAAEVQDLSFVRHYNTADGHVRGPNFGLQYDSPKVSHTREPDRVMQVVSFAREGKPDVVMVNFQAHPQIATGTHRYSVTADTIGAMRKQVEAKGNRRVLYALGASGNVQAISLIKEENRYADHEAYGKAMAEAVERILQGDMKPLALTQVKTAERIYTGIVNKADATLLEHAQQIFAKWSQDNDYKAAVKAGEPCGINSPYHAKAIIQRTELPDTEPLELYAFSLGELAFVFAPYEMFCENGSFIKERSPHSVTFVSTLANKVMSYIASKQGFDYNCYEANTCRYVKGTAEALAEEFVALLKQLSE